ncbi:MAG: polysaccharide pyruvyl transferase family protein [Clostridiaceae bacterium]|nr:polysaccharide pyruvyl transferase family protein [Clostridiaceae bacterium]
MKKRVGLITMHRVLNFGSALQAYALQKKIIELGFECEIIDYVFPNSSRIVNQNKIYIILRLAKYLIIELILGFPNYTKKKRFAKFYKKYYRLSHRKYVSPRELNNNPPVYDILVTGSDQVWNPKHIGRDTSFMLSFCKDDSIPKLSYSASFGTDNISEEYVALYSSYLSKYKFISVRESSGANIIKKMLNRDVNIVCDPSLLLDKSEWEEVAVKSKISINKPYILVYIVTHSFNPYPEIDPIIRKIQAIMGLHIVYLNGRVYDYGRRNSSVIKNAGPCEFIRLILNSSIVITTSFHGTAMALNFSVPVISVIKDRFDKDSRIMSLLKDIGAEHRAVTISETNFDILLQRNQLEKIDMEKIRNKSLDYLSLIIKST